MTPQEFIAKWSASELKERSASQSHFNDLCNLVAEPSPTDASPKKCTLTNLYNARAWLGNIHMEPDAVIAVTYGWDDYTPHMPDDEILARLFRLNQERTSKSMQSEGEARS